MSVIRLTLAQVNAKVGDLAANALLVRAAARQVGAAGAHLIAFPEMVLTCTQMGSASSSPWSAT